MDHSTVSRTVVVNKAEGLHARPAELFVKVAKRFESAIEVIKNNTRADAKSILHVLTLAAEQGTALRLEATGPDAEAALEALVELVENNFELEGGLGPIPVQ
jgi:phosphotransferase system HPr (HPr) family protein